MNRSPFSRLLLGLLAVLLQVAVLPAQGRLRCVLRTGALDGCCCAVAPEKPEALVQVPSCCHGDDARGDPDQLQRLGGDCPCERDAEELVPMPKPEGDGIAGEAQRDVDDVSADLPPRESCAPRLEWRARPVAMRAAPTARTGPPLHVVLQVFLI